MMRPPQPPLAMQFSSLSSVSPSFTSHSSNNLADIAARVVEEFRNEHGYFDDDDDDDIYNFGDDDPNHVYAPVDNEEANRTENLNKTEENSDEDEEFEFAVVCTDDNSSIASPDLIFFNGEILPRYPLFDRSLLLTDVVDKIDSDSKPDKQSAVLRHPVRQPLRKLFREERETTSCSSSEAEDLDGISPETYCIWKPKVNPDGKGTKSNSTGSSSKRWKFRNLINRSSSDISETAGKNLPDIVLRHLAATKKRTEKLKKVEKTAKVAGADDDGEPVAVTDESNSANKTVKEGNRIGSHVPYKPDLVSVFTNVNGLSRNLHPF